MAAEGNMPAAGYPGQETSPATGEGSTVERLRTDMRLRLVDLIRERGQEREDQRSLQIHSLQQAQEAARLTRISERAPVECSDASASVGKPSPLCRFGLPCGEWRLRTLAWLSRRCSEP